MNLLLTATLLLIGGTDEWQYHGEMGFVNSATMEKKSPQEFYRYALKSDPAGGHDQTLYFLSLIVDHVQDKALREEALFARSDILFNAQRYLEAYQECDSLILKYPDSGHLTEVKLRAMESAWRIAKQGHIETVLGMPVYRSSKRGIDLLRKMLERFPKEDFSDDYAFLLGMYYFQNRDYEEAETEFALLVDQYPDSDSAPLALFKLGEIGLLKFDGIDRDLRPLQDTRRHFQRFIDEYGQNPQQRLRTEEAKEKITLILNVQADQELKIADYYQWKDFPKAAAIYYRSILRKYPNTVAAEQARHRLRLGQKGADSSQPPLKQPDP